MSERREWPLVSVCITNYNRLNLLKETLESFRQCCTYPNLEYVIVDNGSEPDVVAYINSLDLMDNKILNRENMGHAHAMNQARKVAKGEYYFNLENDWYFFYRSNWLERGVLMFENDRKGEKVEKHPVNLPLGIVKYKLGAGIKNYSNNPALLSKQAYLDVGEFPQYGREYKYVSETFHKFERSYIVRFKEKYASALSETPCVIHLGNFTTNPMYGNKGRRSYKELDHMLSNKWKDGKWWFTWNYYKWTMKLKIRGAIKKNEKFEVSRKRYRERLPMEPNTND